MLRSHCFSLSIVSLALVLSATVGACSESTADSAYPGVDPSAGTTTPGGSSGNDAVKPIAVSDAAAPAAYHGNPLCHIDEGTTGPTCMPDDDATYQSRTGCAEPGDPGAMMDGSVATASVKACHLEGADGGVALVCGSGLATGTDGAKCEHSADCGPGFDCVSGDKGTKACRHYCCSGTCATSYAANGGATFCDVQSLVDVSQMAPVCMPIKRCETLLGKGECASTETCTLVDDDGDTGCVAVGQQQVGESCDEAHCDADLACLGQPGARKCFRLCHVSASDCPSGQTCVTNAAFKDSDDGICTDTH